MIRLFGYIREAADALFRNKTRTILTMIGMFIGVGAVDAVFALSNGAAAAISSTVSSGDQPALTFYVDQTQADTTLAQMSYRDATLAADAGGSYVRKVNPNYSIFYNNSRGYNIRQGDGSKKVAGFGFSWYGDDSTLGAKSGRSLTTGDVDTESDVCMLSPGVAEKLFGDDESAVGKDVVLSGRTMRVVGVVDTSSSTAQNYFGGSYYFVLPYTTFHSFAPGPIDALLIWTDSPDDEDAAQAAILAALKTEHGASAKYTVQSTRQQLEQFQRVLNIVTVSLTAIGAISLLVAGIGIMNIMLVSVTERTREIGIRKSIGANSGDIILQFLIEAVLMALAGGALGLGLALAIIIGASGYLAGKLGAFVIPYATVVLLAFAFSLIVGVAFGVYPAFRASRLDPVTALRT